MIAHGTTEELVKKIREKRNELMMIARDKGINHEETLECSQVLDQLIIEWEKKNT